MSQQTPAPADAHILVSVLTYLKGKNGTHIGIVSSNPVAQEVAVAAAGILATALYGTKSLAEARLDKPITLWASGSFEQNDFAVPQLIAGTLLLADAIKNGI